jgi:hypothetical protein
MQRVGSTRDGACNGICLVHAANKYFWISNNRIVETASVHWIKLISLWQLHTLFARVLNYWSHDLRPLRGHSFTVVLIKWLTGRLFNNDVGLLISEYRLMPGLSLGNYSVKGFRWQRIRMQRSRYCWTIKMETVFSMWFVLKSYK